MMEKSSPLLDAHVHLQDKRFSGDLEAILKRAENAGVRLMFCNATSEEDWENVLALSDHHASIMPFMGIHPWWSHQATANWRSRLQRILTDTPCGVGEIGLDKHCRIPLPTQIDLFTEQLKLAITHKRPVVIHCVKCWGKCLEILEELLSSSEPVPVMIHSFSGSLETMNRLVRLGCCLSFSARITGPDQHRLRTVFQQTPLDRLLLETDAPDQLYDGLLQPGESQAGRNEPERIRMLYIFAAKLLKIDIDTLASQVWQNSLPYHAEHRQLPE